MTRAERQDLNSHLNAVLVACSGPEHSNLLKRTNDTVEALFAIPLTPGDPNEVPSASLHYAEMCRIRALGANEVQA